MIGKHCPYLQYLDLSSCSEAVNDQAVDVVAQQCGRHLKVLKLSNCTQLTDQSLYALAKHVQNLEELHCFNVNQFSDQGFVQWCNNTSGPMKVLDISSCLGLTQQSVNAVATRFGSSLESLACEELTLSDQVLIQVATHCIKLRELRLAHCQGLTGHALKQLSIGCAHLEHFDLSYCNSITDVQHILVNLPNWRKLCTLSMRGCNTLTTQLFPYHPSIISIDLSWCEQLKDTSVSSIAERLPHLEHCTLTRCPHVTVASIAKILLHNTHLRSLNIRGSSVATDVSFLFTQKQYSTKRKGLTIIQ